MANCHRPGDSALGNKTHVDRFRFQIVHRMVHWSRMSCPPLAFFLERWVRTVTQEHSHRIRTQPCASQCWLVVLKGSLMMSRSVRPLTGSLTGRWALLLSPPHLPRCRYGWFHVQKGRVPVLPRPRQPQGEAPQRILRHRLCFSQIPSEAITFCKDKNITLQRGSCVAILCKDSFPLHDLTRCPVRSPC